MMVLDQPLRAVAWDIDGTLVDSEGLHHRILMAVSARYGVPIAADDQRFVGVGMDQVWQLLAPRYGGRVVEADWQAAIQTAYVAAAASLRSFDGALAAMRTVQRAGLVQCCVSNSARAIVDINLAAIGASPFIAFSISRDDVRHGKPDPEPYRQAASRLGLAPDRVLVVEDSDTGALAAQRAGCPVLRVHGEVGDFRRVLTRLGLADQKL